MKISSTNHLSCHLTFVLLTAWFAASSFATAAPPASGSLIAPTADAREPASAELVLPGYECRLAGRILKYHSADPDVHNGLIVRADDERHGIAWETSAVPEKVDAEHVNFVWLFGLAVSPSRHRFELRVNDEPWFEFQNPSEFDTRDWEIKGPDGETLRFRTTQIDRFDDMMGYATLRVPRSKLTPGKPLRLSMRSESANSGVFFITYQAAVRENARLELVPAMVRAEEGNYQPVNVVLTHLGPPTEVVIKTSFGPPVTRRLKLGANHIELHHPPVEEPTDVHVRVHTAAGLLHELRTRIKPVRHWTIDLLQHTHTDIGYTRPQTEILPEHLRFIDTVLDYCDQTDDFPEDAKFRWTCEISWAVREYLASRPPGQIERLRQRVKEGRIEIGGMFLNMSELMDEASFAAFLRPIREIREQGFRITGGMQNDINGVGWCLPDHFAELGIKYLTMGQHGHRALAPFDIATPFWWESPSGNRVLAFRADHYMTGNFWGVHTGKVEVVAPEALRYLAKMEKEGYPFDRIGIQYSGYPTDNSPPSTISSELVRDWNKKYVWPRLRCSIARDFMDHIAGHHAEELEVHRKAWPDWWTDGFGSAARESAAARRAQGGLVAVEGLLAMETLLGIETPGTMLAEIDEIRDDLLFYGEHTFGSAESIREPLCENSVVQWRQKSAYAWDAVKRLAVLGEGALGRLPVVLARAPGEKLVVINTLNRPRSGVVELYVDHELLPVRRPFRIVDEAGGEIPAQLTRSRSDGSYWAIWARDVPAFGWRTFRVEIDPEGTPTPRAKKRPARELANEHYRLRVDEKTGAIASLVDLESGREYVDSDASWGLGQIIHESLGNRQQLEGFSLDDFKRSTMSDVVVEGVVEGPVWSSLFVRGELPGCGKPGGVRMELRLFHPEKRIELHYTIQKRRVTDPEGLYVAFPFGPGDGQVIYETLGGIAAPADILSGAATDWQTMQGFAAVQWKDAQAVLSSNEIPLIQLGEINMGKFRREMRVDQPHIFSWVMNNYWTTNFRASQEGEFRWSYALTSSKEPGRGAATHFGASHRVPILGRVVPGGGDAPVFERRSVLSLDRPNLTVVSARPADRDGGAIFHVREVEGRETPLADLIGPGLEAQACDVLGIPDKASKKLPPVKPYGILHFRVRNKSGAERK